MIIDPPGWASLVLWVFVTYLYYSGKYPADDVIRATFRATLGVSVGILVTYIFLILI